MAEQLGNINAVDSRVQYASPGSKTVVLDCASVPDTVSTIATLGQRSISCATLARSASCASMTPLASTDGTEGCCSEWLLQQRETPGREVRRLVESLEERLCSELRRMQARADDQFRDLDQRLSCLGDDMQLQRRRIDALDGRSSDGCGALNVGHSAGGSFAHQIDDLGARVRQAGLALVNFNERIGALESKQSQVVAHHSPSLLLPEQQTASTLGPADSALRDIRAELDLARSASTEARFVADTCAENLAVLTRRVHNQERAQDDIRDLQESFFTNARSALTRAESSASISQGPPPPSHGQGFGDSSLMQGEDLRRLRMMQQWNGQPSSRESCSVSTGGR